LKSTVVETRACVYCLGKQQACSLNVPPVEESCEVDADGDLEDAGTVEATASTSAAVEVQTAEAPEAMEEAEGSVVEPSPAPEEGDHAEGVSRQMAQLEQLERELMEVTTGYASPAAEEAVERALGESSDVQEVPGASATARAAEPETVPRQG